ncbi:hypothetical protein [Amycolatopsis sp. NPDC054798]
MELFVIVALAWTNGAWLTAFGVCWNARRRLERKLAERETECRHSAPPVSFPR